MPARFGVMAAAKIPERLNCRVGRAIGSMFRLSSSLALRLAFSFRLDVIACGGGHLLIFKNKPIRDRLLWGSEEMVAVGLGFFEELDVFPQRAAGALFIDAEEFEAARVAGKGEGGREGAAGVAALGLHRLVVFCLTDGKDVVFNCADAVDPPTVFRNTHRKLSFISANRLEVVDHPS